MVEQYEKVGGNLVCALEVPMEETPNYGIIDPGKRDGVLTEVKGLVEKPKPGTAPSNLMLPGRYILQPEVMRVLESGGTAMIVGFARFGAWRPWLAWHGRDQPPCHYASAAAWRRALARGGVDVYAQRRIGPSRIGVGGGSVRLPAALRSSWLLLARKRSANSLLRAHPVALQRRGVHANLASGTQRASA